MQVEKVCMWVRKSQRRKESHGRSTNLTYYLGPQVLRIYDLRNLVADHPPLRNNQCLIMVQGCCSSEGSSQAHPHPRQSQCSQGTAATTYCTLYLLISSPYSLVGFSTNVYPSTGAISLLQLVIWSVIIVFCICRKSVVAVIFDIKISGNFVWFTKVSCTWKE